MLTFTILCAIMCLSVVSHLYDTSNKLRNKTKITFINYCV
nr:MAG TPA: hypothetical protein [Caudoviricetes sp.]